MTWGLSYDENFLSYFTEAITMNYCTNCKETISTTVEQFSIKKHGVPLCFKCQKLDTNQPKSPGNSVMPTQVYSNPPSFQLESLSGAAVGQDINCAHDLTRYLLVGNPTVTNYEKVFRDQAFPTIKALHDWARKQYHNV